MGELTLKGISKAFGPFVAVADVDLTIPAGALVCFLGPSGCGKTTLLRLVAGLETPTSGRVLLDGSDITDQPAHRRNFGMVFQSLALFGHLTVAENIAYALRIRGADKAAQRRRADELLALMRLDGLGNRHVSQLSGGQRQRVAIARALAIDPTVFLLDEPLSALDAKLRESMQIELRLLQQRLQVTTILVTHDQREAMTMADLIVVMGDQRVQQVGTPLDIYLRPVNTFVADFIGTSNLLPATVTGPAALDLAGAAVTVDAMPEGLREGRNVTLLVRPEAVRLTAPGPAGANRLAGTVRFVRDVGASIEAFVDCGAVEVVAAIAPKDWQEQTVGQAVTVELPSTHCIVLAA